MGRLLRIVGVAAFAALSAEAEFPASASQDLPTFRSRVQSIEVDVRVTNRNGEVVRDLTKDDFILLDDGIPQTVSTATFVDPEVESPVSRQIPGAIEPDVVNNIGTGRMWVMIVGPFTESRRVAKRFIDSSLGPQDEVAVLSIFGTPKSAQAFTRSRQLMSAAIDRLSDDRPTPSTDLARLPFDALEQVCNALGRIGGRRKTVILVDPPAIWIPGPKLTSAFMAQRDALRCATRNNVAINVVSSIGMSTALGGLTSMAALRALAEETGGDAIVNSNNYSDAFDRFVRDTSAYYLLGYTPSVEHRDGEFHSITVRVRRPELTVRARRGYHAPEPTPASLDTKPAPGLSPDTREVLRLPLSVNGIGIDLFATPFRDGGAGSVLLGAHLHGGDLVMGPGEPLEVGFQAMTNEGTVTPGAFKKLTLDLTSSSRDAVAATGLRYIDRMTLTPGRHQVRFAVHQPNGKTGMVVADVDVPDFARANVSLSGVVLASRLATQLALSSDESIKQLLSGDPTTVRRFSPTDVLTAYAEVYTNARTRMRDVRVRATIAPAGNLRQARDTASRVVTNEPDRAGHTVSIDLADLPAGDHVLTFEARAGRQTATRQVLFSVTER